MDRQETVGGFHEAWRRQVLAGLLVSPTERLRWLEEAIVFASRAGALPRRELFERRSKEAKSLDI